MYLDSVLCFLSFPQGEMNEHFEFKVAELSLSNDFVKLIFCTEFANIPTCCFWPSVKIETIYFLPQSGLQQLKLYELLLVQEEIQLSWNLHWDFQNIFIFVQL